MQVSELREKVADLERGYSDSDSPVKPARTPVRPGGVQTVGWRLWGSGAQDEMAQQSDPGGGWKSHSKSEHNGSNDRTP
jgi:hypothetical protein